MSSMSSRCFLGPVKLLRWGRKEREHQRTADDVVAAMAQVERAAVSEAAMTVDVRGEGAGLGAADVGRVRVLELAERAHDLYLRQDAANRCRLLGFVLAGCTLRAGKLTPNYRQPFDIVARLAATAGAGGGRRGSKIGSWLAIVDDFRTAVCHTTLARRSQQAACVRHIAMNRTLAGRPSAPS